MLRSRHNRFETTKCPISLRSEDHVWKECRERNDKATCCCNQCFTDTCGDITWVDERARSAEQLERLDDACHRAENPKHWACGDNRRQQATESIRVATQILDRLHRDGIIGSFIEHAFGELVVDTARAFETLFSTRAVTVSKRFQQFAEPLCLTPRVESPPEPTAFKRNGERNNADGDEGPHDPTAALNDRKEIPRGHCAHRIEVVDRGDCGTLASCMSTSESATDTPAASSAPAPLDAMLLEAIECALADFLARQDLPENLRAACLHAVLAGGKRLRPILVLESARAAGGSVADAMPAAVAIEFVHAFSLVHDDLPALDNDTMRRGKPTCHVAFGEAMAILAGDCLLALAPVSAAAAAHNVAEIQRELMSGTVRMIAGQVYDTLQGFPAGLAAAEQLELVHHNKTGALLEASCRMGALAAGANADELARLTTYGRATGLMFQIVDDLIDATQTAEHAGKATGKDADAGKLTYPAIHGIAGSRREIARLRAEADDALAPLGARANKLRHWLAFLADRTK